MAHTRSTAGRDGMEGEVSMRLSSSFSIIPGVAILALLAPADVVAQRGRGSVRDGNRLFNEGRFQEARERYLDALRESPTSPLIRFNEGNALYESAEFQQALDAYQQAIAAEDPSLQAKAWYNLGNALYRQQMLQESVEAYRQALRSDPTDPDAKHNLEWVLQQMEQQQQQNQSDQNQNQAQQQDDQQEQQDQQDQQDQEQQQGDQPEQPSQNDEAGEQQQGEPPPMSREEAERLLDAIDENPNEIRRPPPARARAARPKKRW